MLEWMYRSRKLRSSVVDGRGEIVSEGTVNSEPAAIAEFIEARAVSAKRLGLETGPTATWHWHELRVLGLPVICIDARHAKAALMPKLTDTQLVILSAAAQRQSRAILPLPKSLEIRGSAVTKTLDGLRKKGATIVAIVEMLGWLPHTVRAALTGLRQKGFQIERVREDGVSRYHISEDRRAA